MTEHNGNEGHKNMTDSKKLAVGSGSTFGGQLVDRSARFANTWMLSRLLGTSQFGLYTSAITIVTIIATAAAVGLDSGVVFFGSRATGFKNKKKFAKR